MRKIIASLAAGSLVFPFAVVAGNAATASAFASRSNQCFR